MKSGARITKDPIRSQLHFILFLLAIGVVIALAPWYQAWIDRFEVAIQLLALAGITFIITEFLRSSNGARRWLVFMPVRSRRIRWSIGPREAIASARRASERSRAAESFVLFDRGHESDQVALLARQTGAEAIVLQSLPAWKVTADAGSRLWDSVGGATPSGLARAWYSSDDVALREYAGRVEQAFRVFSELEAIDLATLSKSRVANVLTCKSRAAVLVESSGTRSGVMGAAQVWPTGEHRTEKQLMPAPARGADARALHQAHTDWQSWLPGDYDGRVLDLTEISVGQATSSQRLELVLTANETCYRATEAGGSVGSKNLSKVDATEALPGFAIGGAHLQKSPQARITLLTTCVVLLTADGQVVLTHRPASLRRGRGVLSSTAGGVIEIDREGHLDRFGLPSVWKSIRRETREEIGLDLDRRATSPVGIWLSNSTEATYDGDGQGQIVAVVHYLGQIRGTVRDLDEVRRRADAATGAFEADYLRVVDTSRGPECFIEQVNELRPALDQHAYLSCLFAGIRIAPQWYPGNRDPVDQFISAVESDLEQWGPPERWLLPDPRVLISER